MAAARRIEVENPAALARAAADEVAERSGRAVAERGVFRVALAGGSTPRALYALLADPRGPWRGRVDWPRVEVFFGDERCVSPDHPDSNYRMAREALLDHVPVRDALRMEGERPQGEAVRHQEAALRARFGAVEVPALDLVLLGLGADGHTASLFPGSRALEERSRWVAGVSAAEAGTAPRVDRITLTLPVLSGARAVLFLVAGADKAAPLARLLHPRQGEPLIPAARIRTDGELLVLHDRAAGAGLAGAPSAPAGD
jgi:6-phosphogluconolactonase